MTLHLLKTGFSVTLRAFWDVHRWLLSWSAGSRAVVTQVWNPLPKMGNNIMRKEYCKAKHEIVQTERSFVFLDQTDAYVDIYHFIFVISVRYMCNFIMWYSRFFHNAFSSISAGIYLF